MCVEVLVKCGGVDTYCDTVNDLAAALNKRPDEVSDDKPDFCLCNAKWESLGARKATAEEQDVNSWVDYVIEVPPMTDEELGRKWAEKNKKRPNRDSGHYTWASNSEDFQGLPLIVFQFVKEMTMRTEDGCFLTGSAAYAALGASLRRVMAFADGVREVMG